MEKNILVDASAFVAFAWQNDPNHKLVKQTFLSLRNKNFLFITNNYLVAECLTILLLRTKMVKEVAKLGEWLYTQTKQLRFVQIEQLLQLKALKIFRQQTKPRFSFTDCVLIAQVQEEKIKNIFSLDKDLKKINFGFKIKFYP